VTGRRTRRRSGTGAGPPGTLTAVFTARGLPAPAWTDPVITPGTTAIKAAHITELRTATLALQ